MKRQSQYPKRIQKQVSLPIEYWKVIEQNIGGLWVRSTGDALMTIIDKVHPGIKVAKLSDTQQENTSEKDSSTQETIKVQDIKVVGTPVQTEVEPPIVPMCNCGHSETFHKPNCTDPKCKCNVFVYNARITELAKKYADADIKKRDEKKKLKQTQKQEAEPEQELDPNMCMCGHLSDQHYNGDGECYISPCACKKFTSVVEKKSDVDISKIMSKR